MRGRLEEEKKGTVVGQSGSKGKKKRLPEAKEDDEEETVRRWRVVGVAEKRGAEKVVVAVAKVRRGEGARCDA